ncbi:MAG: response regulator, partial [Nitrospirae bacterium]|nr:response regulator [Nitrospirota bacterium]
MKDPAKILVVDDNEAISQLLSETLGDQGYKVTRMIRGEEALMELRRQSYHLVLLDLVLPGMHGSRILHEIKRKFPKTDVIIMTSHASVDTAIEALRLGAQDYLTKPFDDLEMVLRVVRKTLEKRQLLEENDRLVQELNAKTRELESAVQRLSSLNEMSQALHSILDLKELLHFFVTLVASELAAERVSLMLSNRKTGEMMIEAAIGLDEQLARTVRVRVGEGIAGRVVQE